MKNRPPTPKTRPANAPDAGFSLVEMIVVIVVFGILSAAVAVNWTAFINYQNLRSDANALHKELMALKAYAMENGDTLRVTFTSGQKTYRVTAQAPGTSSANPPELRSGSLIAGTITTPGKTGLGTINGAFAPPLMASDAINSSNAWNGRVKINPNSLTAFGNADESGFVLIESKNNYFCILKSRNTVKPELYYKKGTGGKWTKM